MNNYKRTQDQEKVRDVIHRIGDAVEFGMTPELGSKFSQDYYHSLMALRTLGDGNIEEGCKAVVGNPKV